MKVPSKGSPTIAFSSSGRLRPSTIIMSMPFSLAILTPRGSNTLDLPAPWSV